MSDRTPTVSTTSDAWRRARGGEAGFSKVEWNRTVDVEMTTLDALVAEYGEPAFVKLDMEGGEAAALHGLTIPVRGVSFEYLSGAIDAVAGVHDASAGAGAVPFQLVAR